MYKPQPIDTSDVRLSEDMLSLIEKLAENTHDVWAKGRIAQGWTYGKARNDELKQTPCLRPSDAQPDTETEYDRNTALETIKLIIKLGYRIEK